MNYLITIFVLFFAVLAIISCNYKLLFFLTFYSLINDLFQINLLGPSVNLAFILTAVYIPAILTDRDKIVARNFPALRFIYYEWCILLILMVVFGFISPWQNIYDSERMWTQLAAGRGAISMIRLTLEILIIPIIYYWIKKGNISIQSIIKIIGIIVVLNFSIAMADFFSAHLLKMHMFPNSRIVYGRFSGFCCEPRAFGRGMAIALIILYLSYFNKYRIKLHLLYIIIASLSVLISFSASAIIALCLSLGGAVLFQKRPNIGKTALALCGIFILCYLAAQIYDYFSASLTDNVNYKIEKVIHGDIEDQITGEPAFFTRFEVFDRAALNFLYDNPQYLIFGTGPNLISIPASDYLSPKAMAIYQTGIDSVPHSGLVNILARSGLVGLLLFCLFFKSLYSTAKKEDSKFAMMLIVAIMLFFMMIKLTIIYLIIGFIIAYTNNENKEKRIAELNNTST